MFTQPVALPLAVNRPRLVKSLYMSGMEVYPRCCECIILAPGALLEADLTGEIWRSRLLLGSGGPDLKRAHSL